MGKGKLFLPRDEEQVRVIGESGNNEGLMTVAQARHMAISVGLDLIPVAKNDKEVICRICDRGKWEYEQAKAHKKNHKKHSLKEFWFTARIDQHDMETKIRKLEKALQKEPTEAESNFYHGKLAALRYFFAYELVKTSGLMACLTHPDAVTVDMKPAYFSD